MGRVIKLVHVVTATILLAGLVLATPTPQKGNDPRSQFLVVERFARLSSKAQAEQLPGFYRDHASRHLNPFVEALLSSSPRDLFAREKGPYDGNTAVWAQQLRNAESELSELEVADKLGVGVWLNVAARARTMQILRDHLEATHPLIAADLKSRDKVAVRRAALAIQSLDLPEYTERLFSLYVVGDDLSDSVYGTLVFSKDPKLVNLLLAQVEREPKFLVRAAGLFQGPLAGKPAPPALVKLLRAPDLEIRYHAAYALLECRDPKLSRSVVALAQIEEVRFQVAALQIASNLPPQSFEVVRRELLPLLTTHGVSTQFDALRCFSKHGDLAAGPIIFAMLHNPDLTEQQKITVMQSMSSLSGSHWNYDLHDWGPNQGSNQLAIRKFSAWLARQEAEDR